MQNVLLAEPEPVTRGFLERHLRRDGFEVLEAEDGEALEFLERSQPDVVFVGGRRPANPPPRVAIYGPDGRVMAEVDLPEVPPEL